MDDAVDSLVKRLAFWTLICSVSAAPSFLCASQDYDERAMLCGIATFILAYTLVSGAECVERLQRRPFVRRALRIGFGTRIAVSIVFPVGLVLDLFPGMLSIAIVQRWLPDASGFLGTYATTLLHGTFLNVLLIAYMGIVYLVQRAYLPMPVTDGFCVRCGYDLRASPVRCPECGEAVRNDPLTERLGTG